MTPLEEKLSAVADYFAGEVYGYEDEVGAYPAPVMRHTPKRANARRAFTRALLAWLADGDDPRLAHTRLEAAKATFRLGGRSALFALLRWYPATEGDAA